MKVRDYFPADVVELLDGFDPPKTEAVFRDYQRWMTDLIVENETVLLGAFMGSGKTAATLLAIRKLKDAGKIGRVLIVAPLNVAKDTWPDEIFEWEFSRHDLTFSVLVGDEEQRERARCREADIHIINRENIKWLWGRWGRCWPYDMLVYDEASRLKGGNKRTTPKARKDGSVSSHRPLSEFGIMCKTRFFFRRVVELTGTPAPNGLIDLWGPVFVLDKGERLGTSMTAFQRRWFHPHPSGYGVVPADFAEAQIMDRLKDVMYCLKEEDYLELPPVVPNDIYVHLEPKHMAQYRRLEKEHALEEFDVEAVNRGVLVNKLLQFANGSLYVDEDEAVRIHDAKLRALESVVTEGAGRPLMIAYQYRFDVEAIKKRYPKFRVYGETANDKRDWNAGRIPGLILHAGSAGHGLNFQFGGNIWVWYGLTWSLELYQQMNKRLPRSGQKADRCFMHRILARGTMDEEMAVRLEQKGVTQDSITNAVRVRLNSALARAA